MKKMVRTKSKKQNYIWYYYLVFVYACIGLLMSPFFLIPAVITLISLIFLPVEVIWLILNIVLLTIFIKKKKKKRYLILPIYYIVIFIASLVIGFLIDYDNLFDVKFAMFGFITSLFELIMAVYLIRTKERK